MGLRGSPRLHGLRLGTAAGPGVAVAPSPDDPDPPRGRRPPAVRPVPADRDRLQQRGSLHHVRRGARDGPSPGGRRGRRPATGGDPPRYLRPGRGQQGPRRFHGPDPRPGWYGEGGGAPTQRLPDAPDRDRPDAAGRCPGRRDRDARCGPRPAPPRGFRRPRPAPHEGDEGPRRRRVPPGHEAGRGPREHRARQGRRRGRSVRPSADASSFRAALDVWWTYPESKRGRPFRRPFHELPNVLMTPHVANAIPTQRREAMESAIDNVLRFLRGETPRHVVDPEEYA